MSHRVSVTSKARLFTNNKKEFVFSKDKYLKNDNIIWNLPNGLLSKRKHPWVKIFNTITRLNGYDSLSSLFRQNIYNDFLSCVMIHLLYIPWKSLKSDSHTPMVKNAFYSILKALFFLKIFKFLSWFFCSRRKNDLIRNIRLISKFMTSKPGNKQLQSIYCIISHEAKTTTQWNLVSQ